MKVEDLMKFSKIGSKEKIKLGLLAAAVLVLIAVTIGSCGRGRRVAYKAVKRGELDAEKRAEEIKLRRARKKKPAEIQAMMREVGREDPFLPPSEKRVPVRPVRAELYLSGIVSNGGRSLAIINDMLVGEGDMIEDKKIIKIKSKSVVIKEGEKEYILKLGGFEPQKGGK